MFSGRIDRTSFLKGSAFLLGPILFALSVYYVLYYMLGGRDITSASMSHSFAILVLLFITLIWAAVLMPIYFGLMIRRLHDMNLPGWFSLIHFIPFLNIALYTMLLLYPGMEGTNRYGESHSPRDPQGILFSTANWADKPYEPHHMTVPPALFWLNVKRR